MPCRAAASCLVLVASLVALGCGGTQRAPVVGPAAGLPGSSTSAAQRLGFPTFATKNTVRIGGADAIADAAGVARAVYPAVSRDTRPHAVTIVDAGDWRVALAASVLVGNPLRSPLLFSQGPSLAPASREALAALAPTGSSLIGGGKAVAIGRAPHPSGLPTAAITGTDPLALAAAIDTFSARVRGTLSDTVLVVCADAPEYAAPAAGWAAKSGNPILFVTRDTVPAVTRTALTAHHGPKIYVLGPANVISERTLAALRPLGTVKRIAGRDPVTNAIAFARFIDGNFGWGAVDPGHGLVFANVSRPLDAAAGAPLSASGTYGPLLLLDQAASIPPPLEAYLLDIQPGYTRDPVRGVYNHGWLLGDEQAISVSTQGRIDADLEIVPVSSKASPTETAPTATAPAGPSGPSAPPPSPGAGATAPAGASAPGAAAAPKPVKPKR